jgi:hypothetical protein
MGIGREGVRTKVTSGASGDSVSICLEQTFVGFNRKVLKALTYGIFGSELEFQPICLVGVQRIVVEDFNIHLPFLEILGLRYGNAWGEMFVDLVTVRGYKADRGWS